jgi:hypothetical protein
MRTNGRCKKCSGIGCCQAGIPIGRTSYDVRLALAANLVRANNPYLVPAFSVRQNVLRREVGVGCQLGKSE